MIPPSVETPIELPTLLACELLNEAGDEAIAVIVYPGEWFTVVEPPELACRYFDPESITVPADPDTLETAVMVTVIDEEFGAVVDAATDPANWDVRRNTELVVDELPANVVEAGAVVETDGVPAGTSRFAVFVDAGEYGTVRIWTTGPLGDRAYLARAAIVTLITALSVFQPPAPA
jgi:hypothetical protein